MQDDVASLTIIDNWAVNSAPSAGCRMMCLAPSQAPSPQYR